jgi:hypothetical protein
VSEGNLTTGAALQRRMRWEYRQIEGSSPDSPDLQAEVAAAGADGWEMVTVLSLPVERPKGESIDEAQREGAGQGTWGPALVYVFKRPTE